VLDTGQGFFMGYSKAKSQTPHQVRGDEKGL
jgi:hypothetical protein